MGSTLGTYFRFALRNMNKRFFKKNPQYLHVMVRLCVMMATPSAYILTTQSPECEINLLREEN